MDDQLLVAIAEGVATVTLNRPEVYNALSYELIRSLCETLDRLADDPEVRVVVLTGAGSAFCAGGDINDMTNRPVVGVDPSKFNADAAWVRAGMESSRLLHEMPKPTLAVIPGAAAGAGLGLALACDMRLASETAKLTTSFSKIGLSSDFGVSFFLAHLVGQAKARELLFLSETITAPQALEMGLLNLMVPKDYLVEEGTRLAKRLAALSTHAIGLMKENLRVAQSSSLGETLDVEAANLVRTLGHEDFRAALKDFLERR